jgi:hypothetical protein
MKAQSTINRELRRLRKFIETDSDLLATRVAWAVEHAIRWAREDTGGWPSPLTSARSTVELIRKEQGK